MDMFGGGGARVAPTDIPGWRALIKETDELLVAVMGAQIEHLRSAVASRSVGGVPVFVVTPEAVDGTVNATPFAPTSGSAPAAAS